MHQTTNGNGAARAFWCFVGGAVAGGTLGVLLAPQSGRRTRQRITNLVEEGKDRCEDIYDRGRRIASDTATRIQHAVGASAR
jgi:gas vesicle protein